MPRFLIVILALIAVGAVTPARAAPIFEDEITASLPNRNWFRTTDGL